VYVTDKGQAQDEYYKKTLKKMEHPRVPGQRLTWEWVLDFFHVCGYVSKLGDALFGKAAKKGSSWFKKMRHWLRDRHQGVTQVLRSATQHYHGSKLSRAAEDEFWKAYHYLRDHSRWMAFYEATVVKSNLVFFLFSGPARTTDVSSYRPVSFASGTVCPERRSSRVKLAASL
jgi:hypothetical protein